MPTPDAAGGSPAQRVRALTPELLASAAALLADAFFANPAHCYLCPDSSTRRAQLEWLLGANLRLQPDLRASFCLADGSTVNAMGFWTRSTAPGIGALAKLRAGLLAAPLRLGWAGVRRLFEVTREIDRDLEQALGDRPYWYLNNMVVRERLRGAGVGSRLLREQLPIVAALEPSWSIALSTQREQNVVFYRRLGFRVASERRIGTGPAAFQNWILVCDAAQAGAASARPWKP